MEDCGRLRMGMCKWAWQVGVVAEVHSASLEFYACKVYAHVLTESVTRKKNIIMLRTVNTVLLFSTFFTKNPFFKIWAFCSAILSGKLRFVYIYFRINFRSRDWQVPAL